MLSALPKGILGRVLTRFGWGIPSESADSTPSETSDPEPPEPEPATPSLESQILRVLIEHEGRIARQELFEAIDSPEEDISRTLDELVAADEVRLIDRGRSTIIARPGYEPVGYRVM